MHRLFVALRPPGPTRSALAETMWGVPGARWQDDDQLHLTLRFVGEVDRHALADIDAALGQVRGAPPTVALAGVGSFGRPGRPNSLWAGAGADPALQHLQRAVERALVRVGLPPEHRAFKPHVTLARLPRLAGPVEPWLMRHAGLALPPIRADAFLLYESSLGSEGAAYTALARYPLTA